MCAVCAELALKQDPSKAATWGAAPRSRQRFIRQDDDSVYSVPVINVDVLEVVARTLGQSVALHYYEG